MKLKKSTQILLAAAVLVGGGVIFYETIAAPEKEAAEERQQDIFTFESEQVESMTVDTAEKTLKFDRLEPEPDAIASQPRWQFQVLELKASASETEVNKFASKPLSETEPPTDEDNTEAESPENGEETDSDEVETEASWLSDIDGEETEQTDSDEAETDASWLSDIDNEATGETEAEDIEIPLNTPVAANVAYVDYLLSFLTNEQSDREINIPTEQLNAYGLEPPQTTIDITLDNGATHQLNLGNRDFSGQFFYAIANPQPESGEDTDTEETTLLLVSSRLENAIDRPLSEWKEPPPATETGKTWEKE